jgi:8-oxo-dGTP diphosphatase
LSIEISLIWSQESVCFLAKLVGAKGEPNFDEGEISNGFAVMWVSMNEAIEKIKKDNPDDYEGKFIKIRDLCFLEEAKRIITESN